MPYTVRMDKRTPLTKRQESVLRFISNFSTENGYPPTVQEIAVSFDIFRNAAHQHIWAIERKGYIRRTPNVARGLVVLKRKERK